MRNYDLKPPILCRWNGDGFAPSNPYWQKIADQDFVIGKTYRLVELAERSIVSEGHQFAWLDEAWHQLPENVADQYPTPTHLRKRALIQAGYYDEQIIDAGTKAGALRVASGIQSREPFSLIIVRGVLVIIRTAKSQSRHSMAKAEFQASKDAVLAIVSEMIGVKPEELTQNAGCAA